MTVIKLPKLTTVSNETKQFLLPAGKFTMTIQEVRQVKIKSGVNEGKPALNIALVHEGVWVWKQLPMFSPTAKSPQNEKDWFRMSTIAFFKAIGHTAADLDLNSLVGKEVVATVGQQNNGKEYGVQNFIVTFG